MSKILPPRKPDVVQQDYVNACAQLGEKRFQFAVLEAQISGLLSQVDALVGEAKRAQEVHVQAKPPESERPKLILSPETERELADAKAKEEANEQPSTDSAPESAGEAAPSAVEDVGQPQG